MKEIFDMLRYGIIAFLIFQVSQAFAQEISLDTSQVQLRIYNQERLLEYKLQKEFNYDQDPKYERNVLRKWWFAFLQRMKQTIGTGSLSLLWQILKFGLALVAIYLLFRYLLRATGTKMFRKEDRSPDYHAALVTSESGEKELIAAIKTYESIGDFEEALRFRYLLLLRNLDQSEIISWRAYKTNVEYIQEIKDQRIKHQFKNLSKNFEQVVYGDFELDDQKYTAFKASCQEIDDHLKVS